MTPSARAGAWIRFFFDLRRAEGPFGGLFDADGGVVVGLHHEAQELPRLRPVGFRRTHGRRREQDRDRLAALDAPGVEMLRQRRNGALRVGGGNAGAGQHSGQGIAPADAERDLEIGQRRHRARECPL
ncbi:MAG: hypothetical protein IH994_04940 [Proteobacteria bacterium]|nr:hypothetical protein [Pseudomonadota bacterium]